MKNITILFSTTCLLFGMMAAFADGYPDFSVKGFGTLGASGTDTNRLGFRNNIKQPSSVNSNWGIDNDSRLGLQLDVDINETWHATTQWVARNNAGDFFEQNLEWAFLRWRPVDDLDVRVGRIGYDVFMLSDYRNVGYAYLWTSPPHEFYAGIPVYHFDGADIAKGFAVGEGRLTLKAFGGYSFIQVPNPNASGANVNQGITVVGGKLAYEYGAWNARLGYTYAQDNNEIAAIQPLLTTLNSTTVNAVWPGAQAIGQQLAAKNKVFHYNSIGLAYDDGVWPLQMEASYIHSDESIYPSVVSAYLSAGRRFGKVTAYTVLGISETLANPAKFSNLLAPVPALAQLQTAVAQQLNNSGVDEKSVSLGLRWDVIENVALKTQWSYYWLGANGAALWQQPASGPTPDTVNVWTLAMDFVF